MDLQSETVLQVEDHQIGCQDLHWILIVLNNQTMTTEYILWKKVLIMLDLVVEYTLVWRIFFNQIVDQSF